MTTSLSPRSAALALAVGAALLAGPATGTAAAAKHTPCPTTGTTVVKDTNPNVRVYRTGGTLKACLRRPGQRRYVRTLGPWSSATQVAVDEGNVAWTTRRPSEGVGPVDALATVDVRTGGRWLSTVRAAPATDAATPAKDDRVLRLITDDKATAWVTAGGVVAAAVRKVDTESTTLYGEGLPGSVPFHVGRRFALGVAPPAEAPAVAKGLAFSVGGDGDECGGTNDFQVRIPAFGGRPDTIFIYASEDYTSTSGACG
jgi:hypothetical protein